MGLSPQYFWRLTWYDWTLEVYKYHRAMQKEQELIDRNKYFFGKLYATIGNFAGKVLPKGVKLDEKDFFRFNDDTQPDDIDLQELMNTPEIKYRFKKKDG